MDIGAQALDVELVEGAPHCWYVEALRAGRRAREDTEGAHPAQGEQRTGRGVFSVSSSTSCPTSNCTVCTSRREAPPCAGPARAGPSALRWSCSSCRNARTNAVTRPVRVVASSPWNLRVRGHGGASGAGRSVEGRIEGRIAGSARLR